MSIKMDDKSNYCSSCEKCKFKCLDKTNKKCYTVKVNNTKFDD